MNFTYNGLKCWSDLDVAKIKILVKMISTKSFINLFFARLAQPPLPPLPPQTIIIEVLVRFSSYCQ